ncbi:hypothetical protein GUJ93_ZPchr0003g18319 [Zizania palustris]|uniref:Uncharacterized protein n=1 Tax=Zizania palustris TaxID=103762 RepID=A0A8J5SUZ1_ZIZPA|nr:hypothetical protein GUJ93_ZPchr0003g18319 [Zizania palustris]
MSGGGGGWEDEEGGQKVKSMDVEKLENGGADSPNTPLPAVKYYGWRAMPFIIGRDISISTDRHGWFDRLVWRWRWLTVACLGVCRERDVREAGDAGHVGEPDGVPDAGVHMRSVDAATLLNGLNGTPASPPSSAPSSPTPTSAATSPSPSPPSPSLIVKHFLHHPLPPVDFLPCSL